MWSLIKIWKKIVYGHPKDFAIRKTLAEIFIVRCNFTGKKTQPLSVTQFRALQDFSSHTGKTRHCVQKNQNSEVRNGMTCRGCAFQSVPIKSVEAVRIFLSEYAGKIPSTSPFYPSNRLFQKPSGSYFAWILLPQLPVLPWTQPRTHIEVSQKIAWWKCNLYFHFQVFLPPFAPRKQRFTCQNWSGSFFFFSFTFTRTKVGAGLRQWHCTAERKVGQAVS